MVAALRRAPATRVAPPARTVWAWRRTQASAAGSPSGWKDQAAFHRYSRTWTKSTTMATLAPRASASASIRRIWWLLPSTSATQVRAWSGSRRSASSKTAATTVAASSTTLATSHLFRATPAAARYKWPVASVGEDAATVVAAIFDEADRRDPDHARTWVALVDGNNHQIRRIDAEAEARGASVAIVVDFVHVLEYLWKAAWSFHPEGDPAAEAWVRRHAPTVLAGGATRVAGALRRAATITGLDPARRANADTCATYLTNKRAYLDYPTALAQGWPIATGIIEGACRHLVKDRMDLTGARWGLAGAEAILKLRALHSNGDFNGYWDYHLAEEQQRIHRSRYANDAIPRAA